MFTFIFSFHKVPHLWPKHVVEMPNNQYFLLWWMILHWTQRGKWIGKIFWQRGMWSPPTNTKTPSLNGRFKNPKHKFKKVVVWLEGIIKQLILAKQMFVNGSFLELFVFIHWWVFGDAWIYRIAFELNFSSKIDFMTTKKHMTLTKKSSSCWSTRIEGWVVMKECHTIEKFKH